MKPKKSFEDEIRVLVSKRLSKDDIEPIVDRFVQQRLTFAVSKIKTGYEVWRQILPGDEPRIKNRKEGMTPGGIIEQDQEYLGNRNFVCIWEQGEPVFGDPNYVNRQ